MGAGDVGYCGLRRNEGGRLVSVTSRGAGLFYDYLDPHVTNCCGAWFCPAGTGSGYPKYACRAGPELGHYNLAIFFYGCNFDCAFCQNASHKEIGTKPRSASELVERTLREPRITCWCFFGGSPEPQLPLAISASRLVLQGLQPGRVLRVCFEWNGCGNPELVRRAGALALSSGGNVKFDLKCFDENMSLALSGAPNRMAYNNFEALARLFKGRRPETPALTATTLMVPGYVDELEVDAIAGFIARLDPQTPYSLLAFHPDFMMWDLPPTPLDHAASCYRAAKRHMENVNVGNLHILGCQGMKTFLSRLG